MGLISLTPSSTYRTYDMDKLLWFTIYFYQTLITNFLLGVKILKECNGMNVSRIQRFKLRQFSCDGFELMSKNGAWFQHTNGKGLLIKVDDYVNDTSFRELNPGQEILSPTTRLRHLVIQYVSFVNVSLRLHCIKRCFIYHLQ